MNGRQAPASGMHSTAWLLTFTDLVALMLAFFVLLFSMSRLEQEKWRGLVAALTSNFTTVSQTETDRPAVAFQVDQEVVHHGADLGYLAPVVQQQLAADPMLAAVRLERLPGRLVLSLPESMLVEPGMDAPTAEAEALAFAVGGLLRHLQNAVEVHGLAGLKSATGRPEWGLALNRATAFAQLVAKGGYDGAIVARGRPVAPGSPADRLEVVILEEAR